MVLPQYAPSFTKGSTLSSSEALLYTLGETDPRRQDYTTRSRRLDMHLDDEDEADEVIAAAHFQAHMCDLTSPTHSAGNEEWLRKGADRERINVHRLQQENQQLQEELRLERLLHLQLQHHNDTVRQSEPDWDAALVQELSSDRAHTGAAPDATTHPYDKSQYPECWQEWNDVHWQSQEVNTAHIPAARRSLDDSLGSLTCSRTLSSLSGFSDVSFSRSELEAILDELPGDEAAAEAAQQARDMGLTWIRVPGDSALTHKPYHLTHSPPQVAQTAAEPDAQHSGAPVTPEHVLVTNDTMGLTGVKHKRE